ncbi:hypothetical protein J6K35_03370 [bacterium]|nr:hypothetical protein [Lachnospiraceae bacterium]MBP3490885.1 hypothetical protein [bacterium]
MNNSLLRKIFSTVAGIALSITILAVKPMPNSPSILFFGEPEYPSED